MVQYKSGIPNFTDTPDFWAAPKETYEESLALILDKAASFEPGEDYEYSNTNYLLINKILDNALGYGNFQFIHEEILMPLKLNQISQIVTSSWGRTRKMPYAFTEYRVAKQRGL